MQRSTTLIEEQEKVELFLSCRKLKNMDYFSLTDPQIKLYIEKNGQYVLFGKTEMIQDNLNPNFTKSFILDYYFEVKQKLKFEIIDIDGPNETEFVGEVLTTLGEIVGSKKQTAIYDIMNKSAKTGKLVIQCEKVARNNSSLFIEFHGSNLKNVEGFFGKSNPVLKLSRAAGDSGYVVIYETEVISKNLNPIWKPFEIKVQKLCNGDYFRPIKAEVFSRSGYKDKLIGESQFTLNDLKEQELRAFTLVNKAKNSKDGILKIKQFSIVEKPDFLDYLRGGVQLSVILAIDFTGSNGDPSFPNSLHAIKYDGTMNEYQKAIHGVCDILLNYDYDKKIPVFGFGGKPKYQGLYSNTVQHCFPVNGNPNDPWCSGLDGIMSTYAYGLQNVELSGPTLFAPILQQAMRIAQNNKSSGSNEYTILLIITDGEIHDMEPTINCLIKSALLPLSVIIVGVGNADFSNMEILDGDEGLSNSNGVKAERDLVQFVPFRNFQGSHEMLAKHVLEEVPDQLVEYMTRVNIRPNAAQGLDVNTLFKRQATLLDRGGMEEKPQYGQPGTGSLQQMPMAPPNGVFGATSLTQIPSAPQNGVFGATSLTQIPMGGQPQGYGQPMMGQGGMYGQFGQPGVQQTTQSGLLRATTIGATAPQQNVQLNFMNPDPNKQLRGGYQTMGPGPYGGNY